MLDIALDRFEYKGYGVHDSFCRLEIFGLTTGRPIVVVTELDENPGTSVTNACEGIANAVYKTYIEPHGITPDKVRFIEHYPDSAVKWSEVFFKVNTDRAGVEHFEKPEWKHVKDPDWLEAKINQK